MPDQVPSQIARRFRILGWLCDVETTVLDRVGDDIIPRPAQAAKLYRARDEIVNRDVWIKIVPAAQGAIDPAALLELFRRDAMARPPCVHPNIIRTTDLGEDGGLGYVVFEGLKGRSLLEAMKAGISLKAGLPVILQVLDGLAYSHEQGIIHCDIRPANVFVCSDGCAKIINFAAARMIDTGSGFSEPVQLMRRVGSPSYMSPEAARNEKADGRTDIFSVGCVLYEMVTGQRPFLGESATALQFKIVHDNPDMGPIPDGPEWKRLRDVITRALRKKPEDRYPDALAMRKDLELALRELGDSADWTAPRQVVGTRLH